MSRLLRLAPFESPACECRPGHTLRWLCGVTDECPGLPRHCDERKPRAAHHCGPADRIETEKEEMRSPRQP
jgi:hypothetical protein